MEADVINEEATYHVRSRRWATSDILALELAPSTSRLSYRPGQYVLICDAGRRVPERSYSIANAPSPRGTLWVLVARVPGGETSGWLIEQARPGTRVLVSGPYGTFVRSGERPGPELHLAAGSGLAPVLALLEAGLGSARPRTLIVSARTEAGVPLRDRLERWQRSDPAFTFLRTLTREPAPGLSGRVPAILPGLFPDLSGHTVYIAGGDAFVEACRQSALRLGAERSRVLAEEFFFEPHRWEAVAR